LQFSSKRNARKESIGHRSDGFERVKNAFADFFVVCAGTSDTQIDAIADSVDKEVWEATRTNPKSIEGKSNREWILLDYYDVIVHVFKKDKREFYKLEELWGDAQFTYIDDEAA
jgi:ribosome-associated protein